MRSPTRRGGNAPSRPERERDAQRVTRLVGGPPGRAPKSRA
ncbi:hypothetical protein [Streptomyces cucumeris]